MIPMTSDVDVRGEEAIFFISFSAGINDRVVAKGALLMNMIYC